MLAGLMIYRHRLLHKTLCGLLLGVVLGATMLSGLVAAADSEQMPLAVKSLLLDGQVAGDHIVVVGERGHILLSEDQGRTWQQQAVPTSGFHLVSPSASHHVVRWADCG